MATKTTTKSTAKKGTTAHPPAPTKATPAAKAAAAVAAKAAERAKAKAAALDAEAAKPAPKEALDLLAEKPKRVKKVTEEAGKKSLFAPISKIRAATAESVAPAPAPTPAPVSETKPPSTAAPGDSDVEGAEEKSDDDAKVIHLKPPIVVRDLAAAMELKPFQIIADLMEMNIFAAINHTIEPEIAAKVCAKHGLTFEREKREKGAGVHKQEVKVVEPPVEPEKPPTVEELEFRAPIVTIMGHVDHGKTTLMDAIRKTRVAAGEAGGITQHIGAYAVVHKGADKKEHRITFLDTPGHAAFTAMRARGANVTDIVVLVVAADDGIMPQTIEAMNHAKAAHVQIVVAITKMDAPGANIDRVKGQLQDKGLAPEDWGGNTICCPVSAIKGEGVQDLLETIMLVSEISELKATAGGIARASVIEAQIEQGRGPTATVIVKTGTLKVGDPFICGNYDGKVKSLIDDFGKPLKSASPSMPCKVLGFAGLPLAGDELVVMENERSAKQLSGERLNHLRLEKLSTPQRATLETLFDNIAAGQRPVLRMILKADVQGSLEAIDNSLHLIDSKKIDLNLVHGAVGPISENDVLLATASNAIIVGFGVKVEAVAATTAKHEGVQIKLFSIIYELIDQVKEAMAGLLEPENRETAIGHAEIKKVFDLTRGTVAGCVVTDGRIARNARARVTRGRQPIYDGGFSTLRRFQDDVKEVRSGLECGIKLGDFNDYEVGDIIECYTLEKIPQKL
ncbi:MAG: translation initiation factor IF-2 [Chthoniobacteraceae bacterium]